MSHAFPAPTSTRDDRWLALAVLCTGMLMIVLDATIVNVALPAIQRDLGFDQSSLAWVVNAYLIAFGGVLLLAGRLGDLLGRRRIFLAGLTVFTVASLLCGLSDDRPTLILARFVQGVGGAMTSAVILGMIVTMFTESRERTRAISLYSFVASAGASIGLLAGGVLTAALNWHWIFFVNLPIGIVTGILAVRLLEDDPGLGLAKGADILGAILVTGALMLGVFTIIRTSDVGWTSVETLVTGAAAIAALVAFVIRESRTANPLLPLRILRSRTVAGANAVMLLLVAAFFGTFFIGSLFLEQVLGFDALGIGLGFLPISLSVGAMSILVAEPLITRFGSATVLRWSLVLVVVALAWFARLPADATYAIDVLPSLVADRHGRRAGVPLDRRARDVRGDPRRRRPRVGAREHDPPGRRGAGPRGDGLARDDARRIARRVRGRPGGRADRRIAARARVRGAARRGCARDRLDRAPFRGRRRNRRGTRRGRRRGHRRDAQRGLTRVRSISARPGPFRRARPRAVRRR